MSLRGSYRKGYFNGSYEEYLKFKERQRESDRRSVARYNEATHKWLDSLKKRQKENENGL